MNFVDWIGVGLLGGVGALLRFGVLSVVASRFGDRFPWGTLGVNVSGSFALGVLSVSTVGPTAMLLAGAATLGSYTTFSTWMRQTYVLDQLGHRHRAALNVLVSLIAGLTACALGRYIAGTVL